MHSESLKELSAALAKAQGAMGNAVKDSRNPHFQSSYADLASVREACRAPFAENGLSVAQVLATDEAGGRVLRTMLLHSSGEWLASDFPLLGDLTRPQVLGSLLTYARRYSLAAIAGIAQDDDDGNAAQEHANAGGSRTPPPDRRETPKPRPAPPKAPKPEYRDWLDSFCADINAKWIKAHPGATGFINAFGLNKHLMKHVGRIPEKSEVNNFAIGKDLWESVSGVMAEEAVTYCRAKWREAAAKLATKSGEVSEVGGIGREPGGDDE